MKLRFATLCCSLALCACSVSRLAPEPVLYGLEPAGPSVQVAREWQPLKVGRVRVASSFEGSELVYRLDDVRYTRDYYNRFMTSPARMLAATMTEWLAQAGPSNVVQADAPTRARYALEATFLELYGDFSDSRGPQAVVTVQFSIVDDSSPSREVMFDETIGRRITIERGGAPQLVRGYNIALAELLAQLGSDLSQATSLGGVRGPPRGRESRGTAQRRPPPS
jgi:uncharacterized lipoprotein YmbA